METTITNQPEGERTDALEKTDYIAIINNAWGVDEHSETIALLNALRNYSWKDREKPVPYMICEAAQNWQIDGFGTVTARTVKRLAEGEISFKLAKRAWTLFDDLQDAIKFID